MILLFLVPVSQIKNLYKTETISNKENRKPREKNVQENGVKKQKKVEKQADVPKQKSPKSIESALTAVSNNYTYCDLIPMLRDWEEM